MAKGEAGPVDLFVLERTLELSVFAVLGLVFGSFANVVIYRLPWIVLWRTERQLARRLAGLSPNDPRRDRLEEELREVQAYLSRHENPPRSLLRPPSHCPHCGTVLRWWENVPLLSFFLLRGRCRHCGAAIGWRYPLVEALSLMLFLSVPLAFPGLPRAEQVYWIIYLFLLLLMAFIDLDHHLLPDELTLGGAVVGIVGSTLLFGVRGFRQAVVGALVLAFFLWVVRALGSWLLRREAMGWGDILMALMMGSFLGVRAGLAALALAILLAAGLLLPGMIWAMVRGQYEWFREVPFGVYLALGGVLGFFFGEALAAWYLSLIVR